MKIKTHTLYQVPPRWLFLKIETDEGITGWGEPVVEGKSATVKAAVDELMEYLIGKDPMHIEDHWNTMYRGGFYRGGPILMSAIAGIDQALWDIKGKYFNAPVYELMGGKARDKIKVYSWIGGDKPSDVAKAAKTAVANGFTAIKMNATGEMRYIDSYEKIERVLQRVASVCEAVGKSIGIAIDFHGRLHKPMAKVLVKELGPFHPMFIEEPVLPENNEALRELTQHTSIPIATGERMFSRWHFKNLLMDGYVDIIQPDVTHADGITECKKIISMAEAFDVAAAPGWKGLFIITGIAGIIWGIIWYFFYRNPTEHPRINEAELHYIESGGALVSTNKKTETATFQSSDLKEVFMHKKLWGIYIGQFCLGATMWFFLTWFPTYLVKFRKLDFLQSGILASAPFLAAFTGILLSGFLSDYMIRRKFQQGIARKTPVITGLLLTISIIGANYVNSTPLIILFMCLAFFGNGFASITWAFVSTLAPKNLIGLTGGVFNFIGGLAGIIIPVAIGYLVTNGSFELALFFIGTLGVAGVFCYVFLVGKVERIEVVEKDLVTN